LRTPARGWYDPAVVLIGQQQLGPAVERWMTEHYAQRADLQRRKAAEKWDLAVQAYLIAEGLEWITAQPSLFEHMPFRSTCGNYFIGGALLLPERKP
jgi:hypothetical protein